MKNYIAYDSGFFETNPSEFNKFTQINCTYQNKDEVQQYFKRTTGVTVVNYFLFEIPNHMKRGRMDNAKILLFELMDGWKAKRFNNSQHLRIK